MNTKTKRALLAAGAIALFGTTVLAAPGGIKGPPGGGEEAASNNLSFPVVFSDNARPPSYVDNDVWTFFGGPWTDADEDGVPDMCTTGVPVGSSVPGDEVCYYDGVDMWWLQQRAPNRWQAFDPVDPDPTTPVVVSAIDWGDLLESTPALNLRKIRTEVTLMLDATADPDFAPYVVDPEAFPLVAPFETPCPQCFAAFEMSGAVPGTDQSINEIQGTSFGPGTGDYPGTQALIDPTTLKRDTVTDRGFHATVYTRCARFLIQKVTGQPGDLRWSSVNGHWGPVSAVNTPVVELAAYDNSYSAEINAGGSMIFGYNWNAKLDSSGEGTYRISFVLDGGPSADTPRCNVDLNTEFDETTIIANPGEVTQGQVLTRSALESLGGDGSEGGLTYVDVALVGKGSGGGGGGGHGGGKP